VYVPVLPGNWVYQLTWYKVSPMKWSKLGNVMFSCTYTHYAYRRR